MNLINEVTGEYASSQDVIGAAIAVIDMQFAQGVALTDPNMTRDYLKLRLGFRKAEVFAVLFMDQRHRVIRYEEMFYGTIDGASVYPREVLRRCIELNAAAIILAHNHPSGVAEPSQSDMQITKRLKDTLALVDIRVLDHIVVGKDTVSFSERGLI